MAEKQTLLFGRWFYGWAIVFAAWFIMFFCAMAQIGSFAVFYAELLDYFGWSRGTLALGMTLNMMLMAFFGPMAGAVMNRLGPRRTVFIGAVLSGMAMALVSLTKQPWHFYVFYGFLVPLGISLAFFIPAVSTVRRWFSRRAALAVSLAMTGAAAGIAIGPILAQVFIDAFGWQWAYRLFALILVGGVLACTPILKKDPESVGTHPDGIPIDEADKENRADLAARTVDWPFREVLKTSTLWLFVVTQIGFMMVVMAMLGHLKVWVEEDLVFGASFSVAMVSLMAVMAGISRFLGGIVSDVLMNRFGRKPVLYFCILGVTFSTFYALTVDTRLEVAVFAAIMGFTYGSGVGVFTTYLGDLYGVANMPVLLGLVGLESQSIGAVGPWIFGTIYDNRGSYDLAFIIGGAFCLLSLISLSLIRHPVRRPAESV